MAEIDPVIVYGQTEASILRALAGAGATLVVPPERHSVGYVSGEMVNSVSKNDWDRAHVPLPPDAVLGYRLRVALLRSAACVALCACTTMQITSAETDLRNACTWAAPWLPVIEFLPDGTAVNSLVTALCADIPGTAATDPAAAAKILAKVTPLAVKASGAK